MTLIAPLPTQVDGSLGRVKTNARSVSNLSTEVPADEFNTHSKAIYDLCQTVGLSDGSTPGSVIEELDNHETRITALEAAAPVPGRYTAGIVVGIATAGDTVDMCDYLDAGDGVVLQTAITTASAAGKDVHVRPGNINLTGPITVTGIVRFSGSTTLFTNALDRRALILNSATVENAYITLTQPSVGATGAIVVDVNFNSHIRNTTVTYSYSGNFANMSNESARTIIGHSFSMFNTILENIYINMPNFESVGIAAELIGVEVEGSRISITNAKVGYCDVGIAAVGDVTIDAPSIDNVKVTGIKGSSSALVTGTVKVNNATIKVNPSLTDASVGVLFDTGGAVAGMFGATIANSSIVCTPAGLVTSTGISLVGTGQAPIVQGCSINNFPVGISGSNTQTHASILGNIVKHSTTPVITIAGPSSNVSNNILI